MTKWTHPTLKAVTVAAFCMLAAGCSDSVDGGIPEPVNTTTPTTPQDQLPPNMDAEELVSITTSLDKTTVKTAEWAKVTCIVKDTKGQTAQVNAAVTGSTQLMVDGLNASSTVTGQHEVRCTIPSMQLKEYPAVLHVVAGDAHQVSMVATPALEVYELGDTVALSWKVSDVYGNEVSDVLGTLSGPTIGVKAIGDIAEHNFQFVEEGLFTFTVTLIPPNTHITDSIDLVVDGTGPVITIKTPSRGETVVGLGQPIEVVGTVEDAVADVAAVTINGKVTPVDFNGSFVGYATPQWGMNLIKVEATDTHGNVSVASPSYHYSHSYTPFLDKDAQGVTVDGGVEILMGQKFLDNGIDDAGEAVDLAGIIEVILSQSDISLLLEDTIAIHKEWPVFNKVWPTNLGDLILNGTLNVDVTIADSSDIGPTSVSIDSRKGGIDTTFDIGSPEEEALLLDLEVSITFPVDFILDIDGIQVSTNATAGTSFVVGARIDRLALTTAIDMHKNAGEDLQVVTEDLDVELVGLQIDPIKDLSLNFDLSFPIIGDISLTLPLSEYFDLNALVGALLDPLTEQLLPAIINFAEPIVELLAGDLMADFLNNFTMERTLTLPALGGDDEAAGAVVLGEEPVVTEGKKVDIYTNLTTVQFEEVGAQIGLALGVFSEKGIQRSPLGAIRRDGCFVNAQDTLSYDWERAFGIGMKTDSLNAALFAIWWSGFLNEDFDLAEKTEGLDLGLTVTETKLTLNWLLAPMLNDCQGAKNGPKLQVGDLEVELSVSINDVPITAKVFVDFSSAVDFVSGPGGLEIKITNVDAIEIEVVEISHVMLGVLHLPSFFDSKLTEWLPSQLEGKSFGPYNIPELGFADLMPGLPEGVSLELGNLSVENSAGFTTFSADLQ